MVDIVVLGSLNMDLSVQVPRIPLPGETISGGSLLSSAGGKGANQAAACARLGADVAMIGCVGGDEFGLRMKGGLTFLGVDTTLVREDPTTPTGTAMILVDAGGENCIVLSPGANHEVVLDTAAVKLITQARMLLVQLEIQPEVVFQAVTAAHAAGVSVLFNPAPALPIPSEIYPLIDYLVPNETEATLLSGVDVVDPISAEKAAHGLLERGSKAVIVTLGAAGALLVTSKERLLIPAFKVQAVDTTAAGDAFIGGLASALVQGAAMPEALRFASAAGALTASRAGAQKSLPSRQELGSFLKLKLDP
jgi:ribokinase